MTEPHTRRHKGSWLRRALRFLAPVPLVVLIAAPVFAARIVQVRVGNHPTFSRVVFELDTHTGYQIESRGGADSNVLALLIDAESRDREVISKSLGVGSVSVEAVDGKSLVLVTLRRDDLRIKEMILSNPPRIVLDFEYPTPVSEVASTTPEIPAPIAAAPAGAEPETIEPAQVEPEPIQPETVTATPVVTSPAESDPTIEVADSVPSDDGIDESRAAGPGSELAGGTHDATPSQAPTSIDSMPVTPKMEDSTAQNDTVSQTALPDRPAAAAAPTQVSVPVERPRRIAESKTPIAQPQASPKSNAPMIAAIVTGLLLVAGVTLVMRRRGSILNDVDVTALPEEPATEDVPVHAKRGESEPTEWIRNPQEGFEMSGPPDAVQADAAEATAVIALTDDGASAGGTAVQVSEANTAAYSLSEVSTNAVQPGTELFDEDPEGEKPMDMEANDLPAARGEFVASPTDAQTGGAAAHSELSSMVQELMTRLGTLETRLEESNEARERLESQVSTQSEELRVQRAAIARTQRALRSLSRTDEDQATEPALRKPSA